MDESGHADHLGVILAGGRSLRMGRDKATLPLAGGTLLEHMAARLRDAGLVQILVSGERPGWTCIADIEPARGPLGALASVIAARLGSRLLVVPVDMPQLPASWLAHLLTMQYEKSCLHYDTAPLPLRIDATTRALALARQLLDEAGTTPARGSLRALITALDGTAIAPPTDGADAALANINTPQQWQSYAG